MNNNEKTVRDIARYAGCECKVDIFPETVICKIVGLDRGDLLISANNGFHWSKAANVHPLLRTIEQRNEEELAEINKIWKSMKGKGKIAKLDMLVHIPFRTMYSKVVDYLRSIGIDCDGLIDSGVAIRKG